NWSASTPVLVPPASVTSTSTAPAASDGEVTVQVVVVEQLTEVPGVPPTAAVVEPTTKPVPVMVTTVPTGPAAGEMPVTTGEVWLTVKVWLAAGDVVPVVSVTVRVAVYEPAVM